jgi:glycine cleavage system H protein
MTTVMEILEAVGTFIVGLGGRFGLFLVLGLVLAIPALFVGFALHAWRRRRERGVERVGGIAWRHGAYHAPNHTWLAPRRRGELAVGIDDLGQRLLPAVTAVELPRRGLEVHRGDPIAILRAGARTVRIGAPVDGTVVRVNGKVRRDPALVKQEPYGAGWLFTIAPGDGGYMKYPQDREAEGWMAAERARLDRFLEQELGYAAADGGVPVVPGPAALGEAGWKKLIFSFLHAA